MTDSEKKCHEDVARLIDNNDSVIFSYTHEDQVTIPEEVIRKFEINKAHIKTYFL